MNNTALEQTVGIEKLLTVVARLRDPNGGCPWDLKQTHQSLSPYMLEEAYEAVEAIGTNDMTHIKEELGDVLLQVALHAQIASEAKQFDFSAVAEGIADKLIRRHPHVFADTQVANADEVVSNWDAIKKQEKQHKPTSVLDGVSKQQPALSQALVTSQKAVKVGFEWPNLDSLWACVMSEFDEFKAEIIDQAPQEFSDKLEDEMGDILFATVNLARYFKINPEVALVKATQKFSRRFQQMEAILQTRYPNQLPSETMSQLDFEAWDALWNEAKQAT